MSIINFLNRFANSVSAPGNPQRTERSLNWGRLIPVIAVLCPGLIFLKIADVLPQNSAAAEERKPTPSVTLPGDATTTVQTSLQASQPSPSPATPKVTDTPTAQGLRPQGEQETKKPKASHYLIKEADGSIAVLDKKEGRSGSDFNPMNLTKAELKVLETLSSRRVELDEQGRKSDLRMALLQASEQRIDQKLERLEHLRTSIEKLLKKHEAHEQDNFKRLFEK